MQVPQTIGPNGAYRVESTIGRGGFATVYRAYHTALERHVAIKVLRPELTDSADGSARFRQEARASARLAGHPNIVTVYDYGEQDGSAYLVLQFVDGATLEERLARPIGAQELLQIVSDVASALDFAHARNLVHRDIKPSNILLDSDGRAILSDFGIAKLLDATSSLTGAVVGTPDYMSPEQITGGGVEPRSDVYSLGIVVYRAFAGQLPFRGQMMAVMHQQVHEPPPPMSAAGRTIPPGVETVVKRALSKRPGDRQESAGQLATELADALRPAILVESATDAIAAGDIESAVSNLHSVPPTYPGVDRLRLAIQRAQARSASRERLADLVRAERWGDAVSEADRSSLRGVAGPVTRDLIARAESGLAEQRARDESARRAEQERRERETREAAERAERDRRAREAAERARQEVARRAEQQAREQAARERESREAARQAERDRQATSVAPIDMGQTRAIDPRTEISQTRVSLEEREPRPDATVASIESIRPAATRRSPPMLALVAIPLVGILAGLGWWLTTQPTAPATPTPAPSTAVATVAQPTAAQPTLAPTPIPPTAAPTLQPPTPVPPTPIPLVPTAAPPPPAPTAPPTSVPTLAPTLAPTPVPLAARLTGRDGAELAIVPAGQFAIGENSDPTANPRHTLSLPDFYIDMTEVTNARFAAFVQQSGYQPRGDWRRYFDAEHFNPRDYDVERGAHPVVNIAWADADAYCRWAGRRLPTEIEWEKAARGTDGRRWPWGNTFRIELTNVETHDEGGREPDTLRVGRFPQGASPHGALDMTGNVREWTDSTLQPYPLNPATSPPAGAGSRVTRGGSWLSLPDSVEVTRRLAEPVGVTAKDLGFRCAVSPDRATAR